MIKPYKNKFPDCSWLAKCREKKAGSIFCKSCNDRFTCYTMPKCDQSCGSTCPNIRFYLEDMEALREEIIDAGLRHSMSDLMWQAKTYGTDSVREQYLK